MNILQFIKELNEKGIQENIFNDCKKITSIKFDVKDVEHAHVSVTNLSECLHVSKIK